MRMSGCVWNMRQSDLYPADGCLFVCQMFVVVGMLVLLLRGC